MMDVAAICECIGAKRFVWIDDEFGNTPGQLGRMLIENKETALACGFEDINAILETADADLVGALEELVQHLTDRDKTSLPAIRRRFFEVKSEQQDAPKELDASTVGTVCDLLKVAEDDRHHFDDAEAAVADLASDDGVCFVIDLMDVATRQRRGLDVLRRLAETEAKGVAFILTHETTTSEEAIFEAQLGRELDAEDGRQVDLPICVIAKERLYNSSEPAAVHDQLAIALKRAGLRKCMHEVLRIARSHVDAEFADATRKLLLVPPETLDAFAIERAYTEGLSELHVVERALSSRMSKGLRRLFGTDEHVRRRADIMQRLRAVQLETPASAADPILAAFQQDEIFEGEELINTGLTPIACGDVFETFKEPALPAIGKRRFLLVGQPCDIALRGTGKRDQESAYLIPISTATYEAAAAATAKGKLKEHHLPFAIDGNVWVCDLRGAAAVRLCILDLSSLRPDGRVQADDGEAPAPGLLPGLRAIYDEVRKPVGTAIAAAERTKAEQERLRAEVAAIKKAEKEVHAGGAEIIGPLTPEATKSTRTASPVSDVMPVTPDSLIDPDLLLTLANDKNFRPIRIGVGVPATKKARGFVTWRLRRVGRIQMPFATAILDAFTGVMTRRAYELDFARPKFAPLPTTKRASTEPDEAT